MNENAELLNFVYQNSQMGVDTLNQLIGVSADMTFKKQLQNQYNEYENIHKQAQTLLNKSGYDEKGLSPLEKTKTYLMVNLQTMMDKSTSHISEMLIIGSNMGVVDATKKLHKYTNAEPDIRNLMDKLSKFEENNIQKLKEFL